MFYGSLDTEKLLRPLRKYYSADGSMEIKHNIQTGDVEFVTYIGGDGYTAPIVLKSDGTTQNYLYLQRDYQGSIVGISDETGQIIEKRLFDAWGNVLVQDGTGNVLTGLTILDRGYTGHEHLQSVGLIHMNGRLYDAKLYRFLQPDNYVQDPSNTQNYNRYGYVLNNPLKYIDPSGEQTSPNCDTCGGSNLDNTQYGNGIIKSILEDPKVKEWLDRNLSARNFDEAGTAVGKAARDATNFVVGNVRRFFKGLFGGNKNSGPLPNMASYANIQMPTQHNSFGFNWTYLSQGKPGERAIYDIANTINVPIQFMMGRSVGDGSMRNLDSSSMTTDQGVMGFANIAMTLVGVAEVKAVFSEMYAARGVSQMAENTIYVTREGVALPKGARIPNSYIENPFRSGDYGEMMNGSFKSKVRIDQGTPRGFAGPERSHFHLNNGKEHIFDISRWPWWY